MSFLTSHSGSPSRMSGGGSRKFGPCFSISLYGVRSDAWKLSCIFHVGGNSNLYATFDILATTLKGPYHLGASFFDGYGKFKFVPSSQTLSLIWNGLKLLSFTKCSCVFFIASCASCRCFFNCSMQLRLLGVWRYMSADIFGVYIPRLTRRVFSLFCCLPKSS
jgi:hypothetical protein